MDIENIRELRLAWPFKPFDLILKGGRRLPVTNPLYLAPSDTYLLYTGERPGFDIFRPSTVESVAFRKRAGAPGYDHKASFQAAGQTC